MQPFPGISRIVLIHYCWEKRTVLIFRLFAPTSTRLRFSFNSCAVQYTLIFPILFLRLDTTLNLNHWMLHTIQIHATLWLVH
mmetsp:Transcript_145/g.525  ORF Transcript_145/g.525 Transcript_145/m.525 type:complete len:82 (-) Transcript_145:92-337(-)